MEWKICNSNPFFANTMKILVTGATGFLGNHIINSLLSQGHIVIATSTNSSKASQYSWINDVLFKEYSFTSKIETRNLFDFFDKPDLLIHLAWQGLPNYKKLFHIEENLFSNFLFLKNLIHNGLKNLAVTGTCLEYGLQSGCLNENAVSMPTNPYALAKDTLRKLIETENDVYDFSFKWIRLFYMYGQGQHSTSLIPQLEKAISNNETEFLMSGGEQLRDYLPAEVVAKNIVTIAIQKEVTGIINCCSGEPVSVKKFVEKYIEGRDTNIKLSFGHYPYPDYEPMEFWGDVTKLNKILNHS